MKRVKFHLAEKVVSVLVRSDDVAARTTKDLSRAWTTGTPTVITIDWEAARPPTYINAAHVQMVETEVWP